MNRGARSLAVAAAMSAAAACDGTGIKSGNVMVALTGATPARAAQFRVVGPHTGITAGGANVRVFVSELAGDTAVVAVVANQGHTLSESQLASVAVPDVSAATGYSITLLQVASPSYALQNVAAYTVTIQK